MAITFGTIGNISESVFEHLRSQLVASGIGSNHVSGTFIHGFLPEEKLKRIRYPHEFLNGTANVTDHIGMPVITFETAPADISTFELGSTDQNIEQRCLVSIFALDDIDLKILTNQIVFDLTQKSVSLLDYASSPENPSSIGTVRINPAIRIFPVRSSGELSQDSIDRHRVEISFIASNK